MLRKTIRSSGKLQTLKIKSYEPSTFSRIREVSGVTDDEFRAEWDPQTVANNVASKGAGKSGALFVVSNTRKFLLKTLRKDEKDKLRELSHDLLGVRNKTSFTLSNILNLTLTLCNSTFKRILALYLVASTYCVVLRPKENENTLLSLTTSSAHQRPHLLSNLT